MTGYVLGRALQAIVTLLAASVLVFLFIHLIPGDPALVYAGADPTPEKVAAATKAFGLDKPLPVQYVVWLSHVIQGDFGYSYFSGLKVASLVGAAFPATVELTLAALLVALVGGISSGVMAATHQDGLVDYLVSSGSSFALSLPNFWVGIMLILVFSLWLGWLPPGGRDAHDLPQAVAVLILPACTLGLELGAIVARYTRSAILEVAGEDYVRTAHAKGISSTLVLRRHVLRNALIPISTVVGIESTRILGGAVVVESVFAWPGLGRLMVNSLSSRDYLVTQAILLMMVAMFVVANLAVDLLYTVLDPRVVLRARSVP